MKISELIITHDNLLKLQKQCEAHLLNSVLDELKVITTEQSNFWDVTTFLHNKDSKVELIDRVQVVSLFILMGGRVELDSHMHDFFDWQHFWNYVYEHKYINKDDYDFLCGYWTADGKINRKN